MKHSQKLRFTNMPKNRKQQGVALIVVLGMLSVIFVIATISIRLTLLAERSARNDRDRQVAYQAAEAALADAELDIMGPNAAANRRCSMSAQDFSLFKDGCGTDTTDKTRGLCNNVSLPGNTDYKPLYAQVNFDDASNTTRKYVNFGEFTGRSSYVKDQLTGGLSAKPPRYIIETVRKFQPTIKTSAPDGTYSIGVAPDETAFLVTALGYGVSENTRVMLQALIFKPLATPGC